MQQNPAFPTAELYAPGSTCLVSEWPGTIKIFCPAVFFVGNIEEAESRGNTSADLFWFKLGGYFVVNWFVGTFSKCCWMKMLVFGTIASLINQMSSLLVHRALSKTIESYLMS